MLSQERRLYLHPTPRRGPPLPLPIACSVLALAIVVEPSPRRGLAADCPLYRCLGFNLAPSSNFFLLSLPSHSGVSHPHVVVLLALGVPSISKGCFSNTLPCKRTEWLLCLKFQEHLVTPNFTALNTNPPHGKLFIMKCVSIVLKNFIDTGLTNRKVAIVRFI